MQRHELAGRPVVLDDRLRLVVVDGEAVKSEETEFFGFGPYRMGQFREARETQDEWFRTFRRRHGVPDEIAPEKEPEA